MMNATRQACRLCGCTATRACKNPHDGLPCHWVTRDLCSACVARATPTLSDAADLVDQYMQLIREGCRDEEGQIRDPAVLFELRCLYLGARALRTLQTGVADNPRVTLLIECVARYHNLSVADLLGERRNASLVLARHQAAWILVRRLSIAPADAAKALHRCAATVHYALRQIDNRRDTESRFADRLDGVACTVLGLVAKAYP